LNGFDIGGIWDLIILEPMINTLIVLSHYLFDNFGLTIIVLTIVVRVCMYPLTVKQLHATKAMQSLQPRLAEIQKKYAKDRQKLGQEQMKLYKESGLNPMGCVVPMLIQMPIWIALYQSIIRVLAVSPEDFLGLSRYLYSWPAVYSLLPLSDNFLWLNLAVPDRYLLLPILVGGSMWLQQKMMMTSSADPKQQQQAKLMLWMMPLMFAFLTMQFPSGLALYWVTSNVISIVMQYFVTGWGGLVKVSPRKQIIKDRDIKLRKHITQAESGTADITQADISQPSLAKEEGFEDEGIRSERQDRGGGYPARISRTKHKPRKGRGHRPKRR